MKVGFDSSLRLEFHGSKVTSDAGLLAYRELDGVLGLFDSVSKDLSDVRTGRNVQHAFETLLRQSVYSRLAGYEDVNDATRMSKDPAMRAITRKKKVRKNAASTNTMGHFETEMLTLKKNLVALSEIMASGPHTIEPGDSITVAWALIVGDSREDLTANAQAAQTKYRQSLALAAEPAEADLGRSELPRAFTLAQNHPNPFNPSTTIEYSLPAEAKELQVRLSVFNLRGALVVQLVDEIQSGGRYTVNWNGTDQRGRPVPSGVYFYRLQAGDFRAVRKMVVLK